MDNLINSPLDAELSKLSPFELKGRIIAAADEKVKNAAYTLLNAGRGNPNWLAIECRKAFFALGMFAVEEAERDFYLPEGIAGVPQKEGISVRFEDWMRAHAGEPGVDFLKGAYEYALTELSADADSIIDEWAGGIMGHNYPTPPPYSALHRKNRAEISRLGNLRRQSAKRHGIRPLRSRGFDSRHVLLLRCAQAEFPAQSR